MYPEIDPNITLPKLTVIIVLLSISIAVKGSPILIFTQAKNSDEPSYIILLCLYFKSIYYIYLLFQAYKFASK